MASSLTGRCACGGVMFEVTPPTKWCANCHCSMCRRAHMAAWVTWVGVESSQFRLLGGQEFLVAYQSSPVATREFCGRCGSTMFFRGERWASETHIARAAFDGPLDRELAADVFVDDRATWHTADDTRSRFGGLSGTEPVGDGSE